METAQTTAIKKPKTEKFIPKGLQLFRKKRYVWYVILTIVLLVAPFITINGIHIFLLSFTRGELHLFFVNFNFQELYVLPFLTILLFVGIFLMTTMGGRVWCGWGCPQTIFRVIYRDLIQTKILRLRKKISNKQQPLVLNTASKKFRYFLGLVIFFIISAIASADFLFYFVAPIDFWHSILNITDHFVFLGFWIVIGLFLFVDGCFIAENFCVYICPYARVQSVLYDNDTIMAIYNENRGGAVYMPDGKPNNFQGGNDHDCIDCLRCVQVCPAHIDIRKGMQLECVNCLECVDACTNVMGRMGKKSLVTWSSPNAIAKSNKIRFFRPKTIGYIVVLILIVIIAIVLAFNKKDTLLNINRTQETYEIRRSGAVDNAYKVLIENTDSKPHNFKIRVVGDLGKDIYVISPKDDSFEVAAQDSRIIVLVLRTNKNLSQEQDADTKLPIKVESYAVDDPKISIIKDSIFMYPTTDRLNRTVKKLKKEDY
ncbi:cytochrome c oxidase accessory protein CcoG [Helicobacter sp. 13S00401-1]|uniref:cytochrome c oxidase accessory protein CcoG n=1 Tax=Helicobacter sp. 13S00401-1 TaxID=1905758 RepID=UPI000BA6FA31|nr:cytochrome c oxidase accessory protein CcoG [Helicobacter sp. 13S00401-1]